MSIKKLVDLLVRENNLTFYKYNSQGYEFLAHSVKLELSIENHIYESWGVSENEDLAFLKALMELIERVSLSHYCSLTYKGSFFRTYSIHDISNKFSIPIHLLVPSNSNGLAIGVSPMRTKASALNELIERHVLLSALYLNVSPEKVPDKFIKIPDIHNHQISFYFWKLQSKYIVLAVDLLSNGGYLFTHSCDDNLEKSVQKSFEEMIPNIIHFDRHSVQDSSVTTVIRHNDINSFSSFWKFSPNKKIEEFIHGAKLGGSIPVLENIFFSSQPIPSVFNVLDIPLFCYRAISPQAQQLFFDNWNGRYMNPRLLGKGSFPSYPHFIS